MAPKLRVESKRGKWDFTPLNPDTFAWTEETAIPGEYDAHWVTAGTWIFEIVEVERGDFAFASSGGEYGALRKQFALFLPKFSIAMSRRSDVLYRSHGIWSKEDLPAGFPEAGVIFELDDYAVSPRTIEQVKAVIGRGRNFRIIESRRMPDAVAIRAKRALDSRFREFLSIAEVAARLRCSPSLLSRSFKRAFALSPIEYRNALRVMEARFLIARNVPLMEAATTVGFKDLSRLDKTMKKASLVLPSQMQGKRKPKSRA